MEHMAADPHDHSTFMRRNDLARPCSRHQVRTAQYWFHVRVRHPARDVPWGTYYQWTALEPVKVGSFSWLQVVVLANPLIYVAEGMRAALTDASHMSLVVIYPVLVAFSVLFMILGMRGFRDKVLS